MGERENKDQKIAFCNSTPPKLKKKYICKVNNLKVF